MRYPTHTLSSIANIHTVQLYRDAPPEYDNDGNAYAISIRDVVGPWPLDISTLTRINLPPNQAHNCIRNNDILMPARGDRYPARLFNLGDDKIIPVGQINVIQASANVNETYLTWYLNRKQIQKSISGMLTGTNIKSLNKSKLLSLKIILPEFEIQEAIARIQSSHQRKLIIQNELMNLEKKEIESVCEEFFRFEA